MDKICIVKLRKKMAPPAGLEKECGPRNDTSEDKIMKRVFPGSDHHARREVEDAKEGGDMNEDGAERVVSLMLTRDQVKDLRSHPSLAAALSEETSTEWNEIRRKDSSIVIKFQFDSMPPLRLLKTEEVIHMLRISKSYLNKEVKQGSVKSYRFGRLRRFTLDDILSYLADHQESAEMRGNASQSRLCRKETV